MIEQMDINLCEKCVDALTSETDLDQIIDCEEKKAEAENDEDDKKKGKFLLQFHFLFISMILEYVQNNILEVIGYIGYTSKRRNL